MSDEHVCSQCGTPLESDRPRVELERDPANRRWLLHIVHFGSESELLRGAIVTVPDDRQQDWTVTGPRYADENTALHPDLFALTIPQRRPTDE